MDAETNAVEEAEAARTMAQAPEGHDPDLVDDAAASAARHAAKSKVTSSSDNFVASDGTGNSAATTEPVTRRELKAAPVQTMDDGTLDLDQLNRIKVKLGGRRWIAIEPTIEVNKKIVETLPKAMASTINADGDVIPVDEADEAKDALSSLYRQVALIIEDPVTGQAPSREFVEKHLSGRNFGLLMDRLNEQGQEGN